MPIGFSWVIPSAIGTPVDQEISPTDQEDLVASRTWEIPFFSIMQHHGLPLAFPPIKSFWEDAHPWEILPPAIAPSRLPSLMYPLNVCTYL